MRIPKIFAAVRLLTAVITTISGTACAPRLYERTTVTLDSSASDDVLEVRYGELDGCLLRHQVPVEYTIRRSRYTLVAKPISDLDAKPQIELQLQNSGLSLRIEELEPSPAALYAEHGSRYLIDTQALHGPVLDVSILRGDEELGREHFRLSSERCRIFSPTG